MKDWPGGGGASHQWGPGESVLSAAWPESAGHKYPQTPTAPLVSRRQRAMPQMRHGAAGRV